MWELKGWQQLTWKDHFISRSTQLIYFIHIVIITLILKLF